MSRKLNPVQDEMISSLSFQRVLEKNGNILNVPGNEQVRTKDRFGSMMMILVDSDNIV